MGTGTYNNKDAARRIRLATWQAVKEEGWFPRGITPTDVDMKTEVNRHILEVEFKTENEVVPWGQWLAMYVDLKDSGSRRTLFLCEHSQVKDVDILDVTRLEVIRYDSEKKRVCSSGVIEASNDNSIARHWCTEWSLYAQEIPNRFVTTFRKLSGMYPGDIHPSLGLRKEKESMIPSEYWEKAFQILSKT